MYGCILAKLVNFIMLLVIAYFSIKIIPFGKYVLVGIIFMPMFLHQAVSISADCMINNIAMLFISLITYLIFKEKDITKLELTGVGILSILLAVSKYVYAPLVGILLILLFSKKLSKKEKLVAIPLIILASAIITIIAFIQSSYYPRSESTIEYLDSVGQNSAEQVKWIISNPKSFVKVLISTLNNNSFNYIVQMIGSTLGRLDIGVNFTIILLYLILLVITCFAEENKFSYTTKQKIYMIFLAVMSIFLVILSLYISWSGVGTPVVEGVQGRYFIPILFVVLLCVCKKENFIRINYVEIKILVATVILNILPMLSIYQALL